MPINPATIVIRPETRPAISPGLSPLSVELLGGGDSGAVLIVVGLVVGATGLVTVIWDTVEDCGGADDGDTDDGATGDEAGEFRVGWGCDSLSIYRVMISYRSTIVLILPNQVRM
jgi:hypothetical protein